MKYPTKLACALILGVASLLTTTLHGALAISTFTSGNEAWTQVNLGSDYRGLADITFSEICPPNLESNSLSFCDPDAGSWLYEAPAKFQGNQSAALGGYLEYTIRWTGDVQGIDPLDPEPHVIIANTNGAVTKGLAYKHSANPTVNTWTSYHVELNENAGWYYMDDNTPMENLPLATRAQMAEVLASVTGLRIRGEFTTGDDTGWLRNVILEGPARLNIRPSSPSWLELSWPLSASNYVLQATSQLATNAQWLPITTSGQNPFSIKSTNAPRFFRMALPPP
jgi:hypothetical protein